MEAIRVHDFELESHPRYGDPKRLHRYAAQVNSQNGEDGIIREIFRRIGAANRIFVEVGVGNGIQNNTAFLFTQGWTGFWIDANDTFLKTANSHSELRNNLRCLKAFITKENVVGLLQQLGVPAGIDLLSLDIDRNTFYVLDTILQKYKPRVVVVEYNAAIPPDIDWKVEFADEAIWDNTQNFGASLKAFEQLGEQFGYVLVGCEFCGINAFFVRHDLAAGKFSEPFTAENHYEPPRYAYTYTRIHAQTILDRIVT